MIERATTAVNRRRRTVLSGSGEAPQQLSVI
jgi:hypothetical protein